MEQTRIRESDSSDINALVSLMGQLGYPISFPEMKKNLSYYLTLPHQKAYIIQDKEQVVGCIAMAVVHYLHRKGAFLRIIALIVDKKHRGKGIGKKLVQKAEKYALKMKCSHIELSSGVHRKELRSHDFYKSMGFIELDKLKKYFGKKLNVR